MAGIEAIGVHGVARVEGEGHRKPPRKQPDNELKLLAKGIVQMKEKKRSQDILIV
jgi:hypothetical protein